VMDPSIPDVLRVDLHVHVGNERWHHPLAAFVVALRARGVTVAGLVDHAEFYVEPKSDWVRSHYAALTAAGVEPYPGTLDGLRTFYHDIEALRPFAGLAVLKGLEVADIEAVPEAFFEFPDYLAHCFGNVADEDGPTFGHRAAARVRRFGGRVRPTGKPGIVNHPFRARSWVYRDLVEAGRAPPPHEFITADDVARLAGAAAEEDLILEVNYGAFAGYEASHPVVDLYVHAVGRLVACGADLCLGSDSHRPPADSFPPSVLRVLRESGLGAAQVARVRRLLEPAGAVLPAEAAAAAPASLPVAAPPVEAEPEAPSPPGAAQSPAEEAPAAASSSTAAAPAAGPAPLPGPGAPPGDPGI